MAITRPEFQQAILWVAAGMACFAGNSHAQAQPWLVEPAINATLTALSNSNYGNSQNGSADAILSTVPSLRFGGANSRMRIDGQVQLENVQYLNKSQADRVLPQATVDGNLKVIDRLMGVDGALVSQQTAANPFGPQGSTSATLNRYTTTQARVSPYLERELTPSLSVKARAGGSITHYDQVGTDVTPRANTRSLHHTFNLASKPRPLGAAIELDYQNAASAGNPNADLTQKTTRGLISYSFYEQLVISGITGRESTATNFNKRSDALGGARVEWRPDERNQVRATVEHRFFGTYWDATVSHRRPSLVATMRLNRQIISSANALGPLPSSSNLTSALDAMLTTRYPEPGDRAVAVKDIIASRGLTGNESAAKDFYALAVQLQQSATARLTILGRRDTFTLGGEMIRTTPQAWASDPLAAGAQTAGLLLTATAEYNHRLTPQTSLDAGLRVSRTTNPDTGRRTLEKSLTTSLHVMLSPKTTATLGGRYQELESTQIQTNVRETAVIAGLNHRF